MAHLLRLIVAAFVAAFSLSSHALVPTVLEAQTTQGIVSPWMSPPIAACNWLVTALEQSNPIYSRTLLGLIGPGTVGSASYCRIKATVRSSGADGGTQDFFLQVRGGACPAHSLAVSGGCQCDNGYIEQAGTCVPKPPECNDGELFSEGSQRPLGMAQDFNQLSSASRAAIGHRLPTCAGNGCALAPDFAYGGNGVYAGRLGNAWTLNVSAVRYTGGRCSPSDKDIELEQEWMNRREDDLAPSTCPTGKGPGTINGTTVCMPYGSVAGSSGTSSSSSGTTTTGGTGGTTAPGDGSGSGPSVIGTNGPSNSSDTTITSCNGTTCTTTTTSQGSAQAGTGTGAGGTGTGGTGTGTAEGCAKAAASGASAPAGGATCTSTTTTTQSQTEFCSKAENKKNVACVNDKGQSSFGGTCAAGFKAQGDDAVLNAMAQEQFKRNCEVLGTDNADSAWVLAERDSTADRTATNPKNSTVSLSGSDIDTSDALGYGARCISDMSIQVVGYTAVLPFSKMCNGLEMLGNVLLGVTLLAAAGIVLRG